MQNELTKIPQHHCAVQKGINNEVLYLKCGTVIQWSLGMTLMPQDLASAVIRKMNQNYDL